MWMKRRGFAKRTDGGELLAAFTLDGLSAGVSYPLTNTRSSEQTVVDFEGIHRHPVNNELAYEGLRRVENLLRRSVANPGSRVLSGAIPASWSWQSTAGVTVSSPTYGTYADGVEYVEYTVTHASGGTNLPLFRFVSALTSISAMANHRIAYRTRFAVTASSGGAFPKMTTYTYTSASAYITQYNTTLVAANTTLADGVYGTATPHTLVGATVAYAMPAIELTIPSGSSITIRVAQVQMQRVQGASNLVAGEYVDALTTYNAGIAGVRYQTTTNANTVNGSTLALTDAVGTAITSTKRGLSNPYTSTNFATYSEELTNGAWTKEAVTITNDSLFLGPDSVGYLQKVTESNTLAIQRFYQIRAAESATQLSSTVHIKSGSAVPFIRIRVGESTNHVYADVNLSTMAIAASGVAGSATLTQATVERLENTDTYAVYVSGVASPAVTQGITVVNLCNSVGVLTAYTGSSRVVYIGFMQYEKLSGATPYIPNRATGSSARQSNTITATTSGFSGAADLAIVAIHRPFYAPTTTSKTATHVLMKLGSDGTNEVKLEAAVASSNVAADKLVAGVSNTSTLAGATGARVRTKWGLRLLANKVKLYVNGVAGTENANATASAHNSGFRLTSSNSIIELIEIYKRPVSDTEWLARTS